jgi:hypothetical protein
LYGVTPYTPNNLWYITVDWNNDGAYDGYNEGMRCIDLEVRKGRKIPVMSTGSGFERNEVGEVRIVLDNYDGRYDAYNTNSIYYPNVAQGRFVQIGVKVGSAGTPKPLFTGKIYDIDTTGYGTPNRTCTLTIRDGWDFLQNKKVDIAVGTTYTTGTAISAVLTAAGWPSIWGSSIATGADSMPYFWCNDKTASDAINEINESEFGIVYIAGNGQFTFIGRGSVPSPTLSVTQSSLLKLIDVPQPSKVVRNYMTVNIYPRILQSTVLMYTLGDKPLIPANSSITIMGDLTYSGRSVASNSVTTPVAQNIYQNIKTISFTSATKTIADSANGLAGFTAGMKIFVTNAKTPSNNGTFTVSTSAAGSLVVSEALVDETAGASVTIEQAVSCYKANALADGSSTDLTSGISIVATPLGTKIKNVITNSGVAAYLTLCKVVGNAIDCPSESNAIYDGSGGGEILSFLLDTPWMYNSTYANNYAVFLNSYLNTKQPYPIVQCQDRADIQYIPELFDTINVDIQKLGITSVQYRMCYVDYKWSSENGQSVVTTWNTEKLPTVNVVNTNNLVTNAGFESNNFTGWTKTTETNGAWSIVTSPVLVETYALKWTPTVWQNLGVITSDRITILDSRQYIISGYLYNASINNVEYIKIEAKWYNDPTAGTLLRTDQIGYMDDNVTSGWLGYSGVFTPPTGAIRVAIVITAWDVQ